MFLLVSANRFSQADYPSLSNASDALETCPSCGSPKLAALKHTDFLMQADPVSSLRPGLSSKSTGQGSPPSPVAKREERKGYVVISFVVPLVFAGRRRSGE